jgi:flavin-dependent dehydrogenase
MFDVVIVGAGPAGAVAATVLARAGARVRLLDRAPFPRDKLCGDTINPGALALLRRLRLAAAVEARGIKVDGMRLTGATGIAIEGRYPDHLHGVALTRRELDALLLSAAADAGAEVECGTAVREAVVTKRPGGAFVEGVKVEIGGVLRTVPGRVTIAAVGRRSTLAFGLGLARHPGTPRRWAIGAYFDTRNGHRSCFGEMHIRRGRYIGVAPIENGMTNVCLVQPCGTGELKHPEHLLRRVLAGDPMLRDRFADAPLGAPPAVLGPLAVDTTGRSIDGLIVAGDAAGFIDPMTGDGLRFAIRGGELAAAAALEALERGWPGVHARLAAARRREFAGKWRFNRTLRTLVDSPSAVRVCAEGARIAPGIVRRLVARAGDCDLVEPSHDA